jgi:hypothetical protein
MAETKTLVREVSIKNSDGTFQDGIKLGASFEQVLDVEGSNPTGYSLKQFFQNYQDFMSEANFIEYGTDVPTNSKIRLWIDTGHNNYDNIG